ncbi:hypothetical protein F0562_001853 [Nyssa sinensis]|uniref:Uncharacterized protein n=1 Tax=Nyssa sinensis TaxID=561372 RepID=A0A5J5C4U4_9ASTE|nr:hypothetical protein F0562_001853 [Nyssa sinensis]
MLEVLHHYQQMLGMVPLGQKVETQSRISTGKSRVTSAMTRYAPGAIADETDRARVFELGLRPTIRTLVVSLNRHTMSEVYDRAQLVKADQWVSRPVEIHQQLKGTSTVSYFDRRNRKRTRYRAFTSQGFAPQQQ